MADVKAALLRSEGGLRLRRGYTKPCQALGEGAPVGRGSGWEPRRVQRCWCLLDCQCGYDSLREPRATANRRPPDDVSRFGTLPPVSRPTATRWRSPGTAASSRKTSISTSNRWAAPRPVRLTTDPAPGLLSGLVSGWPRPLPSHGFSSEARRSHSDSVHRRAGVPASCSRISRKQRGGGPQTRNGWPSRMGIPQASSFPFR